MEFCPRDGARLAASASETEVQLAWGLARRLRIVRRLGADGMGTVFLAEQLAVGNRPVAKQRSPSRRFAILENGLKGWPLLVPLAK
jgi:hypothetical protein